MASLVLTDTQGTIWTLKAHSMLRMVLYVIWLGVQQSLRIHREHQALGQTVVKILDHGTYGRNTNASSSQVSSLP